jgi:hypothetical protein
LRFVASGFAFTVINPPPAICLVRHRIRRAAFGDLHGARQAKMLCEDDGRMTDGSSVPCRDCLFPLFVK